jgi:hypothetical protein
MSRSFSIPVAGSADQFISKAKAAVEKAGGTLTGDNQAGSIDITTPVGSIKARYTISGGNATIHVDDKPFFLTIDKIRSTLTKYLS